MRYLLSAMLLFCVMGTVQANTTSESTLDVYLPSERIKPCEYWRYDSSSGGYTCTSYSYGLEVTSTRDLERVFQSVENYINDLEARVKKLETQLANK